MNIKDSLIYFVIIFVLTFFVTAVVSFLYGLIVHGAGTIDWGTALRFAVILGIVLSWTKIRESKEKK